jgi:hypothetical protein
VGRQRRRLLVPHVDHAYLFFGAVRLTSYGPAHDEEQIRCPLFDALRQNFRACYFRYVVSPRKIPKAPVT